MSRAKNIPFRKCTNKDYFRCLITIWSIGIARRGLNIFLWKPQIRPKLTFFTFACSWTLLCIPTHFACMGHIWKYQLLLSFHGAYILNLLSDGLLPIFVFFVTKNICDQTWIGGPPAVPLQTPWGQHKQVEHELESDRFARRCTVFPQNWVISETYPCELVLGFFARSEPNHRRKILWTLNINNYINKVETVHQKASMITLAKC